MYSLNGRTKRRGPEPETYYLAEANCWGRPAHVMPSRVYITSSAFALLPRSAKPESAQQDGWKLAIVKRGQRAFEITCLTWIVERIFAWLGRNCRMSKDYEFTVQTSEAMIDLATIRLMLNRIAST